MQRKSKSFALFSTFGYCAAKFTASGAIYCPSKEEWEYTIDLYEGKSYSGGGKILETKKGEGNAQVVFYELVADTDLTNFSVGQLKSITIIAKKFTSVAQQDVVIVNSGELNAMTACSQQRPNFVRRTGQCRHCSITNNVSLLATSDAVFFHSRDFSEETLSEYAKNRQHHTPYVLMTQESPHHSYLKKYSNYFNWTMTYRKDSDVHFPYGALVKLKEPARINYTEIWRSKTKEALWLNANSMSHNQRTQLVKKLKEKGMDIDLMGPAHRNVPRDCPRSKLYEDCNIKLHSPYKFYIAFENSNCKGYVTEKFWAKAGLFKMVPIVMSRKIYREIGIPDSMYISIDDFPNLDQFVTHVKNLSNNETEYLKFHKWREDFR
ncbi:CBN-FUT-5 protein [Caenorhabditis brenneri]|uniref:Fucosyltransferase n=1 Tax=Caenorhabditis brenneri TaxID=135651 RepID=G0MRN2_CAEBE|nr:CBN-FUT-5 protein [Caenorhabditis brenneri]